VGHLPTGTGQPVEGGGFNVGFGEGGQVGFLLFRGYQHVSGVPKFVPSAQGMYIAK
jgi:hypothetical protein